MNLVKNLREVYQRAMRGGACNDHDPIGRIRPIDAKMAADIIDRATQLMDELERRARQIECDTPETRHHYFKKEGYQESLRLLQIALNGKADYKWLDDK